MSAPQYPPTQPSAPAYQPYGPPPPGPPAGYPQPGAPPNYGHQPGVPPGYGHPPGYAVPPAQPACVPPPYPQPKPQPKKSKGLFSGLIDDVSKGFDSAARDISNFAGKAYHGDIMSLLSSGNIVQFYYKKTGRTIQIVRHPTVDQLIVDLMGYLSPQAYNAHWFVYRESGNIIKLYNQDNYLAVRGDNVVLIRSPNPTVAPPETRWKVMQCAGSENVISLQPMYGPSAVLTVGHDDHSVFIEQCTNLSARTYFSVQFVAKV